MGNRTADILLDQVQPMRATPKCPRLQQEDTPGHRASVSTRPELSSNSLDSTGDNEHFVDAAHQLSSQPSSIEKLGQQQDSNAGSGLGETSASGASRPRAHAQRFAGRILSFLETDDSTMGDRSAQVLPNSSMKGLRVAPRQVVIAPLSRPPAYNVWGFCKSPPASGGDANIPSREK